MNMEIFPRKIFSVKILLEMFYYLMEMGRHPRQNGVCFQTFGQIDNCER